MAMHKPKKQRRFQDGGDVEENQMKQRGLDISNRAREEGTEKTSFFQRLREGNIDDPNSAAYKKYGAGRARLDDQIEAGKSKLANDVQKMVKAETSAAGVQSSKANDGDVSAYDLRTEAAANAPKINQRAAKPKSGIVTKKQLEESGLSLRDYMNKQQGKTRRGRSAPDAAKPAATTSKPAGAPDFLDPQQKAADASRRAKAESEAKAAEERKNYVPRATPGARKPKQTTGKAKPYMPEQPDMSFRKGGSVSSASKRADGIAQRGKTRGKVY